MALSERARLKGFFFTYFAWVGLVSPFLSLYLADRHYAVAQIAVLVSLPQWMRIVAPPFWGWLSDWVARPATLLWISTAATLVCVALLPLAAPMGFATVFLVLALLFFSSGAAMPIGEARLLAMTAGDSRAYGRTRLWGSIGFIAAVSLGGLALDAFGTATLPAWMAVTLAGLLLTVWPMRRSLPAPVDPGAARVASVIGRLRERPVALFFVGNGLMIFAHAAYYVLFSLFLARHGYSNSSIGLIWTLGVVAEVAMFHWQHRFFERFAAITLLAVSMAVAALRFAMIGLSAGHLAVLLAAQVLHAITFGLHHSAAMMLLHQWFDARRQARAQALYIMTAYGIGGAVGGLALGEVWTRVSPTAAFLAAATAAALGALAIVLAACGPRDAHRGILSG